jgi:hypothetical protein
MCRGAALLCATVEAVLVHRSHERGIAMKHVADNRSLPDATKLAQFLRIERQAQDALLDAKKKHPQPRLDGNARIAAFCRIERGIKA